MKPIGLLAERQQLDVTEDPKCVTYVGCGSADKSATLRIMIGVVRRRAVHVISPHPEQLICGPLEKTTDSLPDHALDAPALALVTAAKGNLKPCISNSPHVTAEQPRGSVC